LLVAEVNRLLDVKVALDHHQHQRRVLKAPALHEVLYEGVAWLVLLVYDKPNEAEDRDGVNNAEEVDKPQMVLALVAAAAVAAADNDGHAQREAHIREAEDPADIPEPLRLLNDRLDIGRVKLLAALPLSDLDPFPELEPELVL